MSHILRALIADDEHLARALLREFLAAHGDIQLVAEASHGLEAARAIQDLRPDLVFLDIQMPKLTGLEVLEATGLRSGVIFTTADDQHALQAFNLHAVDYLLKPFSQARFDAALQRARQLRGQATPGLDRLLTSNGPSLSRVLIRGREGDMHVLPINEVDCIEAQADYVAFHHGGRVHLKAQRMADLEAQLDPQHFVRVHRSFIINLAFLDALERSDTEAQLARLKSGKKVPVSRAGYDRLKAAL